MSNPFLTFQTFDDPGLATALAEKLADANIDYRLEQTAPLVDPVLVGGMPEATMRLKIPGADFPRAHAIIESYYEAQLEDVDPDYYLLAFSDSELTEIIRKPDEWGHFDYVLAKNLLTERGIVITSEVADDLKKQRLAELAKPESAALDTSPFGSRGFGGLFSYFIMATHKKTLPNGKQVYAYTEADRKRSKRLFVIAALVLLGLLMFRLSRMHG